jgi:peptidoglycan/xylan/chitin deacetylase (PgdA/CDA1 family)
MKRLAVLFPGEGWLSEYLFYSINERKFRFLRDQLLTPEQYRDIMFRLIAASKSFSLEAAVEGMWMAPKDLSDLFSGGHSVGLHSHSHPTAMADLSYGEQLEEYSSNKTWIEDYLGLSPKWVAHPCGSYSETTLRVLQELDIRVGFRDSLTPGPFGTLLEIPREDHTNLMSTFL